MTAYNKSDTVSLLTFPEAGMSKLTDGLELFKRLRDSETGLAKLEAMEAFIESKFNDLGKLPLADELIEFLWSSGFTATAEKAKRIVETGSPEIRSAVQTKPPLEERLGLNKAKTK